MLNTNKMIMDPQQYRILNLLKEHRLPNRLLEDALNISSEKIAHHLQSLHRDGVINCDSTSPLNMCRIDQNYAKENPLFYAFASTQMSNTPRYKNDLTKLNDLMKM